VAVTPLEATVTNGNIVALRVIAPPCSGTGVLPTVCCAEYTHFWQEQIRVPGVPQYKLPRPGVFNPRQCVDKGHGHYLIVDKVHVVVIDVDISGLGYVLLN